MTPVPPCPECVRRFRKEKNLAAAGPGDREQPRRGGIRVSSAHPALTEQAEEAIGICDQIASAVGDLPDRASDFGISVSEKAASIRESIERTGRVTDGQFVALENMLAGVNRWLD